MNTKAIRDALWSVRGDLDAIISRASCAPNDDPDEAGKQFTIIMNRARYAIEKTDALLIETEAQS